MFQAEKSSNARYLILAGLLLFTAFWPVSPASSGPLLYKPLAAAGPDLTVNVSSGRHPISPYIYGLNNYNADPALLNELRSPVDRWGGNLNSRYNWQLDATNHGSDFFFENDSVTGADAIVASDRANGSRSIITVPTIGFVAKNTSQDSCGFSIAKYGPQAQSDNFHPDCGNGVSPNGGPNLVGNDPTDTSIAITPDFIKPWIAHLATLYGTAANGGVLFYELDNEPSDWFETHRDVHPGRLTYDELKNYTLQYAPAIKAMDASAKTLGPSNFGFSVYADSQVAGDKAAHGGVGFSEWYLQQMSQYEQANGVRILDYFDQHYYPAQAGVALSPAGDAATQQLRLRSTRSLWDPTYIDESYIGDLGYPPIQLIPTFRKWIADNYPGTKTAITEYNFGGLEDLNGALTQADVLGIFGREQLDLATIWQPPSSGQPAAFAFRIFRNYDGNGGVFGDTSVFSTSSDADQGRLPVYGAIRSSDNALTLVIINKTGGDLTSSLALSNFTPVSPAKVYRYSAGNLNAIVRQADQAVNPGGFTATYPANSITLLEIASSINNPAPILSGINPGYIMRGGPDFTLNLQGSNFIAGSRVFWNGLERTATFQSAGRLSVQILAGDIATAGTYPLTVVNPAPGGGTSSPLNFKVIPTPANVVTSPADDGSGADPNSLSHFINIAAAGSTIGFNVAGNLITLGGALPPLGNGINLVSSCNSPVQIKASGLNTGPILGLGINGVNVLEGITIINPGGNLLAVKAPGGSRGLFKCFKIQLN